MYVLVRVSVGGPIVSLLAVEPTVVLPQQFVERWFNTAPERTSCGSSSAGSKGARGALECSRTPGLCAGSDDP